MGAESLLLLPQPTTLSSRLLQLPIKRHFCRRLGMAIHKALHRLTSFKTSRLPMFSTGQIHRCCLVSTILNKCASPAPGWGLGRVRLQQNFIYTKQRQRRPVFACWQTVVSKQHFNSQVTEPHLELQVLICSKTVAMMRMSPIVRMPHCNSGPTTPNACASTPPATSAWG